ncbi:MAG: hypothetical protein AAF296_03570 [Pseudomonadota bacterium]
MEDAVEPVRNALEAVPPEAWPLIEILFNVTLVFTALWLGWTVFVAWRRSASNLTAIRGASANPAAEPDFLSVDKKARKEAIARGEAFDKELQRRDRDEAAAARNAARKKETMLGRVGRLVSFGMALFSIATMISGTMFQVSIMGRYWEQYSASERLVSVIENHPIGVAVTVAVILYNIVTFVMKRSQEA